MVDNLKKIIVVSGYYGSGKTNLSLNIAIDLRKRYKYVSLLDLDIVNPYFRTSDFKHIITEKNIEVIATNFASSNLDIPSLPRELESKINSDSYLIIDVGGDDAGAKVLGRYANIISQKGYSMLYVHNHFRYEDNYTNESVNLISAIEKSSRLKVDYIVNNSNLGNITTIENIESSLEAVNKVSKLSNKDIIFTSIKKDILEGTVNLTHVYPIDIFVKTPWN